MSSGLKKPQASRNIFAPSYDVFADDWIRQSC